MDQNIERWLRRSELGEEGNSDWSSNWYYDVSSQPIELYKVFSKLLSLVVVAVKLAYIISEGYVAIGELETRKRRKMYDGDWQFSKVLCSGNESASTRRIEQKAEKKGSA